MGNTTDAHAPTEYELVDMDALPQFDAKILELLGMLWSDVEAPEGDAQPFVLLQGALDENRADVMPVPLDYFEDDKSKQIIVESARRHIIAMPSDIMAFCHTAFTVYRDNYAEGEFEANQTSLNNKGMTHPDVPSPADHPNRTEIAMVMVIEPDTTRFYQAEITRSKDAPPTLGQWRKVGTDGEHRGRFVEGWQPTMRDVARVIELGTLNGMTTEQMQEACARAHQQMFDPQERDE